MPCGPYLGVAVRQRSYPLSGVTPSGANAVVASALAIWVFAQWRLCGTFREVFRAGAG
jgi:hypothetical protein